jgi:DNA (cytosine-5)-methyltransferase 1
LYKLIDLFCCAGGMTLGFVDKRFNGRFKSVWAVDNDAASIDTYKANFGDHGFCGDVEEMIAKTPKADIVIGGPPCQGFSLLNKNRTGDSRRELWQPFMDIVQKSGARVFVIENVPGLLGSEEYSAIERRAKKMGFDIVSSKLNAADYGAPQARKRAIIIGYNRALVERPILPPPATHCAPTDKKSKLPHWITVKEAIGDLQPPKGTDIRKVKAPYDLHFGREPTELSKKRYKLIPPGGNRFDLQKAAPHLTPGCWIRKTSGGTDLFGRLWWDRPSVTIRTEFFKPEKGRYLHPSQDRPITHREAARLMGFPDDFIFHGSKIEIARQIGNAVPPLLAKAVASVVEDILAERYQEAA